MGHLEDESSMTTVGRLVFGTLIVVILVLIWTFAQGLGGAELLVR